MGEKEAKEHYDKPRYRFEHAPSHEAEKCMNQLNKEGYDLLMPVTFDGGMVFMVFDKKPFRRAV